MTLLGGAAARPVAAHAQQGERMRRIGVLMPLAADEAESLARVGAFLQGPQAVFSGSCSQSKRAVHRRR